MRLALTGPSGFLAWHVRAAWRARTGSDVVLLGREHFANASLMASALQGVDAVVHLAAVNRGPSDQEIFETNVSLAQTLAKGIVDSGGQTFVVHANSIHVDGPSAFGRSKRDALLALEEATARGCGCADVVLPNVFGEHGKPHYNSFIATFCHQLIHKAEDPKVIEDRSVPLIHAQEAADVLIDAAVKRQAQQIRVQVAEHQVSDVLERLKSIRDLYANGQLPNLGDAFTRDLFNTYRSHAFPGNLPIYPDAMTDQRGRLVEAVRAMGGETQVFFSTTKPRMVRGQHFHRRKMERFLVLSGKARIYLRQMFADEVITFEVDGERPALVDMPTLWAHAIENVGENDLVTLFYADQVFNPLNPDTFAESVIK